jgi:DNA-binding transcriptional LysR family regulator
MAVTIRQLRAFAAVAETGSFTAAARRLGVPKSTASRRVSRLEEVLGVRLLQRTTRQLSLTEAGSTYVELAGRALSSLEEAGLALQETTDRPRGHLRITAPQDVGLAYMTQVVAEFARRYPEVTVEMVLTDRALDLVGEKIDLAIRATAVRPDSSLVARRIGDDHLRFFASPAYLRRRSAPAGLEDLTDHDCVGMRAVRGRLVWRLVGPDGPCEVRVRAAISANDFSCVKAITVAGGGVAILPSSLCQREVRGGKLRAVLDGYRVESSVLYVVYPGARLVPAAVRAFRDLAIERLTPIYQACTAARAKAESAARSSR